MKRQSAYRYELDPNDVQRTHLFKHAGAARFAYNWSLSRRIARFEGAEGKEKFTNAMAEHKVLVKAKASVFAWMYDVSNRVVQEALRDLDRAFKNFWARRKQGVGFPKFKKRFVSKDAFRLYGTILPKGRHIQLPRIGTVRLKERIGAIPGRILSATVSRTADRWYVSLLVEREVAAPTPGTGPVVGVDMGITTFATVSPVVGDATRVEGPQAHRAALSRLATLQRRHARKKKGSNNRRKSAQRIARLHARVANIRRHHLHDFTTMLAKTKSVIVIEDLNVRGMSRNRALSRSVLDQGWGEVRRQLEYKTKWYGSTLVVADRFFPSSKLCSECGWKNKNLTLSIRQWSCEKCGVVHDRDVNAARNLARYPECRGNQTPVEGSLTAERAIGGTVYESRSDEAGSGQRDGSRKFRNAGWESTG